MLKHFHAKILFVPVLFSLIFSSFSWGFGKSPEESSQPNILLVVVDDMGFTDLGSFGGEIDTPRLDALAMEGVRFTNFQVAPTCSPTRAMLLTGADSHKAGLGSMYEYLSPNQKGQPGYEGYLNDRVVTIASLLRDAGYHTYLSGKWHLGLHEEASPYNHGFDETFAMLSGGASHFADMKPAYHPDPKANAPYRENGKKLDTLPESFEYSTQYYADRLIEQIEGNRQTGKPFFAYLAYTAPHWPLHAPDNTLEKYKGRYDEGYDVFHQRRLEGQIAAGLLPKNTEPNPRSSKLKAWEQLTDEEKKIEARQMEVYAAMIDEVDVHTGRVIDYLKDKGLFENTLVLFLSDNGAEGHDLDSTISPDLYPDIRSVIDNRFDFSYENMGKPFSYPFVGEGWARASSPSLKHYKGATFEGGTRVAAFVHYPRQLRSGAVEDTLFSVMDVTPTLLDLADVEHPGANYKGKTVAPMNGISMLPLLQNGKLPEEAENRVLAFELMGKRAVRKGDWKIVHMRPPYGIDAWQLYNLKDDLAEENDLSSRHPEKLKELEALWDEYVRENNVILPDWVSGY